MKYVQKCPQCGDTEIGRGKLLSALSPDKRGALNNKVFKNPHVTKVFIELEFPCKQCGGPDGNSVTLKLDLLGANP